MSIEFTFAAIFIFFTSLKFSYPDSRTLVLAAILNKFPLSVDKSITRFLLCARVFSLTAAILENEKTLGARVRNNLRSRRAKFK